MKVNIQVDTETGEVRQSYDALPGDTIYQQVEIIGETYRRGSRPYDTFSGKRKFNQMIKPEHRELVDEWIGRCRRMHGHMPQAIHLTLDDMVAVGELFEYVMAI